MSGSAATAGFEGLQVGFDGAVIHHGCLGGEGDVAVAERVGPGVEGLGVVPVFELFVDAGEFLDGGEVVGIGVVFFDDLVAAFDELLGGQAGAGGFFQFFELGGVPHEGAHVGVFVPLLLLHGSAGGGVLGALDGDAVGGVVFDDVVVNLGGQQWLFAVDVEVGELVEEFGVFRAAPAHGFKGEGGGFEEFEFEADVEEQVVGLIVERILFEFLFNERQCAFGVFFCMALEFHDAHAAGLDAEEAGLFLGAAGESGVRICAAVCGLRETRAFLENALEERDGVIKIGGLNGGESLEPQGFEVRWEFFFGDLGHGVETWYGILRNLVRVAGRIESWMVARRLGKRV